MFQDSPEDIADAIVEIAQKVHSSYNSINIAIGGILPRDASWCINRVLIKEVNQILQAKRFQVILHKHRLRQLLGFGKWFT